MPNTPYLAALLCECQDVNPLFNLLGARLVRAENGEAAIELPISRCLAQGGGVVAGGVLATLADEAMAHAVLSLIGQDRKTVTTEMNIRYLRATSPDKGGILTGTGVVIKAGRSVMTAEAKVHDDSGRLLATAGGSFFVLDPQKSGS